MAGRSPAPTSPPLRDASRDKSEVALEIRVAGTDHIVMGESGDRLPLDDRLATIREVAKPRAVGLAPAPLGEIVGCRENPERRGGRVLADHEPGFRTLCV